MSSTQSPRPGPPGSKRHRRDGITARVIALLTAAAPDHTGAITPESRLQADLGIDSLARIDAMVAAEDAFGVCIRDDDAERFMTEGDVVAHTRGVA